MEGGEGRGEKGEAPESVVVVSEVKSEEAGYTEEEGEECGV